jgi:hypothetical protein
MKSVGSQPIFLKNMSPSPTDSKNKPRLPTASCWLLDWLTLRHLRWRGHATPQRPLAFNALNNVYISEDRSLNKIFLGYEPADRVVVCSPFFFYVQFSCRKGNPALVCVCVTVANIHHSTTFKPTNMRGNICISSSSGSIRIDLK